MNKQSIRMAAGMLVALGVVVAVRLCWPIAKSEPHDRNAIEPSIPAVAENSGTELAIQEDSASDPSSTRISQERRQQLYLDKIRDQGFDELVNALKVFHDAFGTFQVYPMRGDMFPAIPWVTAVNDRRVRRLYELLREMPADKASARIAAAWESEYRSYINLCELRAFQGDSLVENRYALSCLLLLCSEFCDEATVLTMIDEWQQWHSLNLEQGTPPTQGIAGTQYCNQGGPDPIVVANVYVSCLIKRHTNIDELNARLSTMGKEMGLGGFPALQNTNVYRWHLLYEEQRDDPDSLLAVIPIFDAWESA